MKISVDKIKPSEQNILCNLMKMYCYEWSQYNLFDVDENGSYPFEQYIGLYFERPNRYNYFIRVDGILAGFALIDNDFAVDIQSDYAIGEFFVMFKYRRYGVGKYVAKYLFDHYRGKWQVGFHTKNTTSVKFWNNTINEYTNGKYMLHENCPNLAYNDGTLGSAITFDNSIVQ